MNCWKYEAHARNTAFDHIQLDTAEVIDMARKDSLIQDSLAVALTGVLQEGFVPNIKHGRATVPRNRQGTNGVAFIPDMSIGGINISEVRADIPARQVLAAGGNPDDDNDTTRSWIHEQSLQLPPVLELGLNGSVSTAYGIFTREHGDAQYGFLSRIVMGLPRRNGSHPSRVGWGLMNAHNAEEYGKIPNFYVVNDKATLSVLSQRRSSSIAYILDMVAGTPMVGNYQKLGNSIKNQTPSTAASTLARRLRMCQLAHPRTPSQPYLATLSLTHAFGPSDHDQLPTTEEVAAYREYGLISSK